MEIAHAIASESMGPTITVGEILVEIMATSIGEGFSEPLSLEGPFPSGAPAIFIDQVARMGSAAGIISAVGQDDFGRLNIDRLKRDGADVSAIKMLSDYPTGSAFVRYRADGERDFVFNITRSAAGQISLTTAAEELMDRAGHVHVMGSAFSIPGIAEIIMRAVALVKARGGSVSFDPNIRKELLATGEDARTQLDDILAVTDLLLPSGEELFVASGVEDEEGAVAALLSRGVSEIVLKRGAKGSSCFHRGGRIDSPAFVVEEVDPTGAGDCFGAAYVSCRRRGLSIADSLRYANAAGARTVTVRGPMEGASTFEQLDDFITKNKTEK
ncbi:MULTISPECIES: tagatose kinase [unclassified Rhizobium]|uniref:tagatose kinase n=1 Tax=unclassified Rhizobium TaxID=2613769 RepID=UPI00177C37A2|nr:MULTISPECIES: sugar kinase [unclassified Rhizobium]MBD8689920.1 sugar kinase [Rhizobium sp. CFBP 13644]MBD8694510.1 sugar kinase [Rhizobium sp. CFBP 13717]